MSFKAFGNYIVAKSTDGAERKTDGGIVLVQDSQQQEHSVRLEVVSVSDNLAKWHSEDLGNCTFLKAGDIIHAKFHSGTKVWVKGEEYRVLAYEEVLIVEV